MRDPKIVLFGATGYTGRITAEALLRLGHRPLLVARNAERLEQVAAELGGDLETALADTEEPSSLQALLAPGDVLLTTVGPFARYGTAALEAAIGAGATYIDSTGEAAFIRSVFEDWSDRARHADVALLTAMGYDWVPGNLAGALALAEAGERATRVEIGYFMTGGSLRGALSGGTQASAAGALLTPGYGFRDGQLSAERTARRVTSFDVGGSRRVAFSMGATEQFTLPRFHPWLQEVGVYLGWFGPLARPMQAMSALTSAIARIPGAPRAFDALTAKLVKGSTGGPDAEARAGSGSEIVARALDASGVPLATARIRGQNGYSFTAEMLAWTAERAAAGEVQGVGALGPVQAFGLEGLEAGCAQAGLRRDDRDLPLVPGLKEATR